MPSIVALKSAICALTLTDDDLSFRICTPSSFFILKYFFLKKNN